MKAGIHPIYVTPQGLLRLRRSLRHAFHPEVIKLEICSACHPYYTGQQKLLDTAGRVERFQKCFSKTSGQTVVRAPSRAP